MTRGTGKPYAKVSDARLGRVGMCGAGAGGLGICGAGAGEGKHHDDHRRQHPHRYSRGGDRHPGIGPDATPAHLPDRQREPRGPDPFRAPDYPPAIRHRILSGRGTQAQDLLPQFVRQRGQRQQAGKRRRAHRAPAATGTGLALPDVPDDQVARLFGQLPIPVGQQLPQHRAGLASGKRDVQRSEGFLQPALGARSQVVRPAL